MKNSSLKSDFKRMSHDRQYYYDKKNNFLQLSTLLYNKDGWRIGGNRRIQPLSDSVSESATASWVFVYVDLSWLQRPHVVQHVVNIFFPRSVYLLPIYVSL